MSNPRKPTALKLIEGNKGKRGLNKQEPDPDYLDDLTPPDWLPDGAKTVWNEVVPHLRAARMVTKIDVPVLCKGCVAFAQYRHATTMLGDAYVKQGMKAEYINQWMVAQAMSFKQAMAVFSQFGMTPAARSRVAINPQGDLFTQNGTTGKGYFA